MTFGFLTVRWLQLTCEMGSFYKLLKSNFLSISGTKNHLNRLIFDRVIQKRKRWDSVHSHHPGEAGTIAMGERSVAKEPSGNK